MNSVREMAILCGTLYGELREYIDSKGVTALAMLAKGLNGATVTMADMPNVHHVADALLPNHGYALPVLDVLTADQMEERITAGESAMVSMSIDIGLSADDCEMVIIDHDNPSISLWIVHAETCSLLLLTTFAQLRELVELVVVAEVQGSGVVTVH